jgi:hypothetical protein
MVSRHPGMFVHAQFYAEDGWAWYQQAYNLGWLRSLTLPNAGFLQETPRLAAGLALLVPLRWAPLAMNLVGLVVQALPVTALLSARCRNWGPLPLRAAMAGLYVAIPNAEEIHVVATNAVWHMGLLQALIGLGEAPRGWRGRASDLALFTLGGLSGPYCIMLVGPVAVYWLARRQRWTLFIGMILLLAAVVQAACLVHSPRLGLGPLAPTVGRLVRLTAGDIVLDSMLGTRFAGIGSGSPSWLLVIVFAGALLVLAWGWESAPLAIRLFLIYGGLMLAASLKDPLTLAMPRWISSPPYCRYWFFPGLAYLWAALWCAARGRIRLIRGSGYLVMLLTAIGMITSWRYAPWPGRQFAEYAARFEAARKGERVVFPIYPDGWTMTLVKK